jgi:hypothetical protein
MITTNVPRPDVVECPDCDKPAYRRQTFAVHPEYDRAHGHLLTYDTHAECLTDDAHHLALKRIDAFYLAMHKLEHELFVLLDTRAEVQVEIAPAVKADPDADPPIPAVEALYISGQITRIDFIQGRPSACGVRSQVLPEVTIRAFGLDAVFVLSGNPLRQGACQPPPPSITAGDVLKLYPGYALAGLTAEALLAEAKAASNIPFRLLQRKWMMGDHRHGIQIPSTGQAPAA